MRKLSFHGFLKQYLLDLSGQNSLSIHKLSRLSKKNYRLVDPLLLCCLLENKLNIYYKYFEQNQNLVLLTKENFLDEAYSNYSFQKIYQSYLRRINTYEYDLQTKSLIRDNIIKMMW